MVLDIWNLIWRDWVFLKVVVFGLVEFGRDGMDSVEVFGFQVPLVKLNEFGNGLVYWILSLGGYEWFGLRHLVELVKDLLWHHVDGSFGKKKPTDGEIFNENLGLREWIRQAFPRTIMEVVDANLFSEEEQISSKSELSIASMIELALDCTKETPESRITLKDIVKRLNKIKNIFVET
ncbi:hypothetical protein T459_13740 [Capsicum annuum]|uniref:Uncharacterized protein n=1 Tax=Capsicum annuum TaxID=4072 RepID=A0A2G2ZFQ4_CAPAN|nr:hypothetical protein T459_13740 [Capsicum annuum]